MKVMLKPQEGNWIERQRQGNKGNKGGRQVIRYEMKRDMLDINKKS